MIGLAVTPHYARNARNVRMQQRFDETLLGSIAGLLAEREDCIVRFVCFHGGVDDAYALDICKQLPEGRTQIVPYNADPAVIYRAVAQCDCFLAMRLHSAIFAWLAEVPLAILAYADKCHQLAAMIDLPPEYLCDTDALTPAAFADLVANLAVKRPVTGMARDRARAKAHLNYEMAREVIAR